jgi:single-strand DNA-binding protein
MRGVNRVTLIGNIGKEPDMQYVEGNIPVAKFPLATTETFRDRSGNLVNQTEWHNIVLWRGLAELARKYLHKGSLVFIEGKLRTRYWEDRDKKKHFSTEIVADNLIMLERKKEANEYHPYADRGNQNTDTNNDTELPGDLDFNAGDTRDNLPF